MNRVSTAVARKTVAGLFAAGLALTAVGCQEYASYPSVGGAHVAIRDPNSARMEEMMTSSLRWVLTRYPPPGGRAAINLPVGVSRQTYDQVAAALSKEGIEATPIESGLDLPTYHVARIWLRQTEAKVDVLRPVFELGDGPQGGGFQRGVTIRFRTDGFGPWRVVGTTELELGTIETPVPYYYSSAIDATLPINRRGSGAAFDDSPLPPAESDSPTGEADPTATSGSVGPATDAPPVDPTAVESVGGA